MPVIPSRADTAPSCITPSPDRAGSSSCSAITPPHRRWYCSALRSIPADTTGLPSSVKPSAPASRSAAISVSTSPFRPRVIAARKPTGTRASRRAPSTSERSTETSSTTGSVFGIAITAQKPPAAAAAVPGVDVLLVLLARACAGARAGRRTPGTRACRSPRSSRRRRAPASEPGAPSSAIVPSRIRMSCWSSSPAARIEHVGAADQQLRGRPSARWNRRCVGMLTPPPVGCGLAGRRLGRRGLRQGADEQLVEDRHADRHARP